MKQSKYDSVNINLIDYAHDYIEDCNRKSDGSDKIYNLCVDYIYSGADFKPTQRERLVNYLSSL